MDTKKKKLSRGANGRAAFISVLAALLCIVIGLICGYLALMVINAQHAWSDGFVRILQGGFYDAPYGVGRTLANAAPLIMTGLSVAFAFKPACSTSAPPASTPWAPTALCTAPSSCTCPGT